jgi:hypothetical protein
LISLREHCRRDAQIPRLVFYEFAEKKLCPYRLPCIICGVSVITPCLPKYFAFRRGILSRIRTIFIGNLNSRVFQQPAHCSKSSGVTPRFFRRITVTLSITPYPDDPDRVESAVCSCGYPRKTQWRP